MSQSTASDTQSIRAIDDRFMLKVFAIFAALAAAALLISIGGKMIGRSIALGGHTDDTTLHEIVLGIDVILMPANAIRFERERRDGVATKLHAYLRWPDLRGYSPEAADDFNHAGHSRNILFLSFEARMMSRDMSGRFEPIYSALIEPTGRTGPAGLSIHAFKEVSGYMNEALVVGPGQDGKRFVARCLAGPMAAESLADCERDIFVGEDLSLTYRFASDLLADWRRLDAAIAAHARSAVRTWERDKAAAG